MSTPLVSVILVYFNDRLHLASCLESVEAAGRDVALEAILVDNDSTDGGLEDAAAFPSVRIIRNGDNPGFGAANNRGVRGVKGEFLLFLNTDAVLQPGAAAALLEAVRADERTAAAGPLLFSGGGKVQVSFGGRVDFVGQLVQKFIKNPLTARALRRRPRGAEAGWLSAACLFCRRGAFEAAGGFDESFFLYFEDIDLCFRFRKAGGRLRFVPEARVFHAGGATTGRRPRESRLEYRKSQMLFYRKHASPASLRLLRLSLRIHLGLQRILGRFRGEDGRAMRAAYRKLLKPERGIP